MYLHLGSDVVINTENIIAIYDLDTTTVSSISRRYLANAQKVNLVTAISDELPKSYIVTKSDTGIQIYLSNISSVTLAKRAESFKFLIN